MSYFKSLKIHEWQQFRSIDIDFHHKLTVLTGANASGKTTILNLLARHTDWEVPSLALPKRSKFEDAIRFIARLFSGEEKTDNEIGSITYDSGRIASLMVPKVSSASYTVSIGDQDTVLGFFVPSHRPVYRYQQVTQLPVVQLDKEQAFHRVWQATRSRYFGGNESPSSFFMKEILIGWNIFGQGNKDMLQEPTLLQHYQGFERVLTKVLPTTLGFKKFSIRNMELVLECAAGDFLIDGASGGLSTLIDLAWQIYMFTTREANGFTVIIDEVENHLHPTMQRRLLVDLIEAFPTVRFIVSTHSPLMVTSVKEAAVYVLRYDESKTVFSERLDFLRKARTASQVLDEVLGVSSTLPPWAEEEMRTIVNRFSSGPMNEQTFSRLKQDMASIGLSEYLPNALGRILDEEQK